MVGSPRDDTTMTMMVHDLDLVGCGSRRACQDFGHPWTEEYGCAILVKTA